MKASDVFSVKKQEYRFVLRQENGATYGQFFLFKVYQAGPLMSIISKDACRYFPADAY